MRWVRVVVLAIIMALMQISLMGALRLGSVVPNIVLVVLVAETIWGRASEALLFAVIAGLIIDVASAGNFGLATSSFVVIALGLVASYQLGLDGRTLLARLGLVAAATLVWGLAHVAAVGVSALTLVAAWTVIGLEIVINCLLALPVGQRVVRGGRTV